ncbi:MAG: protein translocase subunit SecF [Nitrospirae bacterium]|nr:protein translocase subunit SecF [Nitrospirota bacterium]
MFEILGKTNIDFIGKRNYAFIFSGLLVSLGLVTLVQIGRGQANLGIDFAGGTAVQLKFEQPIKIDDARRVLSASGFPDAELQEFTNGNRLLVRVKQQNTIQEDAANRIVQVFEKEFSSNKFVVDSSTAIGPTIGQELQKKAVIAIVFSMIGIILYIAVRFEFRFGIAAAIATFHDVLTVLGVLYLVNKEITLLIVTALLTLAGYSLTDKVVVFDRIRENLKFRRRESLEQVINGGINQVLSRTIVVSLTVVLVLVALFFFGGEVIHDFSFALLVGVIVGNYSSIFVASSILVVWKGSGGRLLKRA